MTETTETAPARDPSISELRPLTRQALRFCVVGIVGFAVDTLTVYSLHFGAETDLYTSGSIAFVVAATTTWALNRSWTFAGAPRERPGRQWALFLTVQALGFVLNRGTYAVLIAWLPLAAANPVLAVAAGSLAGMTVNFMTARTIVFRIAPVQRIQS